ncbi:MAG: M23 family metallopeptidase, partial [Oscillospiraceae bacterium]|nr:M23 family metallopeptidase [Oscillospiraceae bacterium]
ENWKKPSFARITIGLGILTFIIAFMVTMSVKSNQRNNQISAVMTTFAPVEYKAPIDLVENFALSYEDDAPLLANVPEAIPVMAAVLEWGRPAKGEEIARYSEDELVFSKTMEDWRVHLGIDYLGDIGSSVMAAADGEVIAVGYDEEWGNYIEIAHINGYISRYASLQKGPPVKKGDLVMRGQVIGGMDRTATVEGAEAPHLHFEVRLEGKLVNPAELI